MSRLRLGRFSRSKSVRGLLAVGGTGLAVRIGEARSVRRWSRNPAQVGSDQFVLDGTVHSVTSADGGVVHATEIGAGSTVILGHGIAGHRGHWAPVARQLVERGHRVVVFEQRGHGESVAGTWGHSLEGLAADVAAVTQQLGGDDPVVLGGHSMGGIGIQAMARYSPEVFDQVRGVALVATMPMAIEHRLGALLGSEAGSRTYRKLLDNPRHGQVMMRSGFGEQPSGELLEYLRQSWLAYPAESMSAMGDGLEGFDLSEYLHLLTPPTVVVCGDRDQITPLAMSEKLVAMLPNATLEVVSGAGHMIIWERAGLVSDALHRLSSA